MFWWPPDLEDVEAALSCVVAAVVELATEGSTNVVCV